jgi:hypothetical protein
MERIAEDVFMSHEKRYFTTDATDFPHLYLIAPNLGLFLASKTSSVVVTNTL